MSPDLRSGGPTKLARFAFVWLVYLGGSITIREGRNVCFDLLLEACKEKPGR